MRTINIYTDGACSGNPGPGGIGVVILTPDNGCFRFSEGFVKTTNNRMEIMAVIRAFERLRDFVDLMDEDKIVVHTDSQLVVGTQSGKFRKRKNIDLWNRLSDADASLRRNVYIFSIDYVKVVGHSGDPYNEVSDSLAQAASRKETAEMVTDSGYGPEADDDQGPLDEKFIRNSSPCKVVLNGWGSVSSRYAEFLFPDGATIVAVGVPVSPGYALTGSVDRHIDVPEAIVNWLNGKGLA